MSSVVIGKRYAKALFEAAKEKQAVEKVGAELAQLAQLLQSHKPLRDFVEHPGVDQEAKLNVLKQAADPLSELMLNALQLILDKGRESVIPAMNKAYEDIADEALGRALAIVYSPVALSDAEASKVSEQFGARTGKSIRVENVVDPSLLGGIKVKIGDRLYDGSLSGKLKDLQKTLA
ncbi:F0F1 ATP synthase subunit delta [Marinicrinis sediminis]|uniref:ATP synthase subunit delta n=1 Tax=Marinicrinis sediminis TaxID=1652465 RepID=A0ABW5RBU5_9BACL